jgi:hypothetical protein
MNSKQGLTRSAGVRSAMLLCCSALVPDAGALDNGDPNLLLHVDGGSVSADIRAEPLVEVARALELKTGVTIHYFWLPVKLLEKPVRYDRATNHHSKQLGQNHI